jgi:AmiR/NasT family two-component response regulator
LAGLSSYITKRPVESVTPDETQSDEGSPVGPLVLVVDDDPIILTTVSGELRQAGFRVAEAANAEEAIARCAAERPAVVIADYRLPHMSGVQLSAELNAGDYVPVIFLSAYSDERVVADALAAGAFVYLVKPIDPPQLLPVVKAALHRSEDLRSAWLARLTKGTLTEEQTRTIALVTGLLMERFRMSHTDAYHRLRQYARNQRVKIIEVANVILDSSDRANSLLASISSMPAHAPDPKKRSEGRPPTDK